MKPAPSEVAAYLARPPIGNTLVTIDELCRWSLPGTYTVIGWIPPNETLPYGDWEYSIQVAFTLTRGLPFVIGDLINYGERHYSYGDKYAQAIDLTGLSYDRLAHWSSVMRRVEFCRRQQNLFFEHHSVVAPLRPYQQTRWLARADRLHLSAAQMTDALKAMRRGIRFTWHNWTLLGREQRETVLEESNRTIEARVDDEPAKAEILEPVGPGADEWPDDGLPWDGDGDSVCCPKCGHEFVPS